MKLSEYVSNFRKTHGYSQRKMAELCHCSFQQISKIEKEEVQNPTLQMLKGIATGTGISLQELLTILDNINVRLVDSETKTVHELQIKVAKNRLEADLSEQILLDKYGIEPDESYDVARRFRHAPQNIQNAIRSLLDL